jgi:hypothetical protein
MHRVVRHVRANVVAYMALFVALGGTSYAAGTLAKNSVGSSQIKRGAVHNSDIASNAVTGSKVAANTLKGADIDESSLGKVPSAAAADSAASATSATTAANAANAANAADAAKLGGSLPSAYQKGIRWALVNQAGTDIIAQSGGISVAAHPFTGVTEVDFGVTTAGHAVWAMQSARDNLSTNGAATAAPCGSGADIYPNCPGASLAQRVDVQTHDAAGALANRSFYVFFLP